MQKLPSPPPWIQTGQPSVSFGTGASALQPRYGTPPYMPSQDDTASSLQQPLPAPPPSVAKKATIWDKDHISDTLLGISQAFLSNQNFGEGLGAAAGSMAQGNQAIRKRAEKSTSYGGPDNRFEITTDGAGNRTVREVPEFARVAQEERDAKLRASMTPKPSEVQDTRSRVIYGIMQLPPEQRPTAYAGLLANPEQFRVDTSGMPAVWSDTYGTIAGNMGMTVPQARSAERGDKLTDWRMADGDKRTAQGAERIQITREKAAKSGLPKAPPSVRGGGKPRSGTLKSGQAMGGYTFMGGDPSNQANWKKQ